METPSVATKVEPNSSNALSENRRRIAGQRLAVETRNMIPSMLSERSDSRSKIMRTIQASGMECVMEENLVPSIPRTRKPAVALAHATSTWTRWRRYF